jgi:Ca-activated chloride channel homolog
VTAQPLSPLFDAWRAFTGASWHDVRFQAPWALLGLALLVPIALALWAARRRRPFLVFSRGEAAAALPRGAAHLWRATAQAAFFVAAALACVAAARPQAPGEPDPLTTEGIDVVVALDISGSMRAADFRPNDRLTVAKAVIEERVLSRKTDRVGLVVFAGEAFTQAPLTHDKALLRQVLEGVKTGLTTDGTAIGDGIATAVNRLRDSKAKTKVVILLTDGDNNAGNVSPEDATALAVEFGIKIFPILIGRGGRVPFPDGNDVFGAPRYVYAEMPTNPMLLQGIAKTANGTFFSAADPAALEQSFAKILDLLDRSRLESGPPTRRPVDLAALLLLPAVLALFAALALSSTRALVVP